MTISGSNASAASKIWSANIYRESKFLIHSAWCLCFILAKVELKNIINFAFYIFEGSRASMKTAKITNLHLCKVSYV
ncbi:hypothetical protein HI914_02894 [Erysiphe necator]|nr:hypothetical protein HI914_02894 [Erysiphe necator]